MKNKKVVKVLSLGLAGVLVMTNCQAWQGMGTVLAQELEEQVQEAEQEEVEQDQPESLSEEEEESGSGSKSEPAKEEGSQEESSQSEGLGEDKVVEEKTTEPESTEELTEESEESIESEELMQEEEVALAAANVMLMSDLVTEDVTLSQFKDTLTFDPTSDWDDKGDQNVGLSSSTPLHAGATVAFDVYLPREQAVYDGQLKVMGVARLGDNWSWVQNDKILDLTPADFQETVLINGTEYVKKTVSFTFEDEITADYLVDFTIKFAGWQCNYTGEIYYANLSLSDEALGEPPVETAQVQTWDFAEGIGIWSYGSDWEYLYSGAAQSEVSWDEAKQAMAVKVDYSEDSLQSWSQLAVVHYQDGFEAADINQVSMDFIYDPASMTQGSFLIKLYAEGDENVDVNVKVDMAKAEDYDGNLKKVTVVIPFGKTTIKTQVAVCIVGNGTDYQGVLYLDNISLETKEQQAEDDIYVDATVDLTGQNNQLSIESGSLVTAAGQAGLATQITLADAQAVDSAKQIYAYLQAMSKTSSVLFGQQSNTHHKAGSAKLSCSDTMDVVGSYAGVIGIDTLSLMGNEYSASRYESGMREIDSAYEEVMARMQAASTTAEKDVIAAAALTNYNIRNGAIITLSAHMPNFSLVDRIADTQISYANYDFSGYTPNVLTGDVMNQLLPGGAYHDEFTAYLDMVAAYASQVDGAIIFRPFHENTGSWFWWGAAFCDAQTYQSVYRYTVEYLRDEKGIHNLLYSYGPGSEAVSVESYGERYPGDAYVDMVGFDMYHRGPQQGDSFLQEFSNQVSIVQEFARQHGKLFAVTETGVANDTAEGDNQTALLKKDNARTDWFNEMLNVVADTDASYFLVWANFSENDGFYTPYVKSVNEDGIVHGHEMLDTFRNYFNDNRSIFAVNQKTALEQLKSVQITAQSAAKTEGYFVAPVSGSRILEPMTLTAKVTLQEDLADQSVSFICKGKQTRTLQAEYTNGYYTAVLDEDTLKEIGEAVGSIDLVAQGQTVASIAATFNIAEYQKAPYEVEDFEQYCGVNSLLAKEWETNKASGSSIQISLQQNYHYQGEYGLQIVYEETADGWAGTTLQYEEDWSARNALQFYTVPDGNLQKTVIQITANNTVYEYYMNLNEAYQQAGTKPLLVTIPFSQFAARDLEGTPTGGLTQDCAQISGIGLWVNAVADSAAVVDGKVSGTFYYDSITAVVSQSEEVQVQELEESKPIGPNEQPGLPQESIQEIVSAAVGSQQTAQSQQTPVPPTYVTTEGSLVSGWEAVVTEAYRHSLLVQEEQPALAASPDAAQSNHIGVTIDVTGVTQTKIPAAVVSQMAQSGADYHFHNQNVAITLTAEELVSWTQDLDLQLYLVEQSQFAQGFDALYLKKRSAQQLPTVLPVNALLTDGENKQMAYLFGKTTKSGYELIEILPVSALGTVTFLADQCEEYIILY